MTELMQTMLAPDPAAELAGKPDVALARLLRELRSIHRMNALVADVWALAVSEAAGRYRVAVDHGLLGGDEQT